MDLIAKIFSSFIEAISDDVYQQIDEKLALEAQKVVIQHQGQKIDFIYQNWLINSSSVCENNKKNTLLHAKCTHAAKSLFEASCEHLKENPKQESQYPKLKNMYCTAATTYEPIKASISWSKGEDKLKTAKRACSSATMDAMGSDNIKLIRARKEACEKYKKLKEEKR